ncbi:cytochrome b/b6 domain-containing protein [Marinivivus vitaminiproducens]|uniref:cytochrome b/b6 domain-containing protein n=1 Tax=Marinivivus vitaminiproducens TaxID=3035935 RepID=UPI0027AAA4B6|nr:cytochrome b/b6 domain-containing protein [Geminicoccaceae bacterium SCSIO 64248]
MMAASTDGTKTERMHPGVLRVMHWTNAVAMIIMIMSGWGIYNDYVIISGWSFPDSVKLGTWAAQSLQWHFAGMWLLVLNGLAYLVYGFVTGRFRRRFLPITLSDLVGTIRDTLRFKLAHDDITHYNAVQKILYIVVILAGVLQVITGIALWKPAQYPALVDLFGGFQGTRIAHFLGMAVIVGFVVVHVALALLVPRTLWAMMTGGPKLPR